MITLKDDSNDDDDATMMRMKTKQNKIKPKQTFFMKEHKHYPPYYK